MKTIGLMHILGEQTRILPSKETLIFALADQENTPQEIDATLAELATQTLIVYRQFKKAYRLYEGSDVDIEARLRDAPRPFRAGNGQRSRSRAARCDAAGCGPSAFVPHGNPAYL